MIICELRSEVEWHCKFHLKSVKSASSSLTAEFKPTQSSQASDRRRVFVCCFSFKFFFIFPCQLASSPRLVGRQIFISDSIMSRLKCLRRLSESSVVARWDNNVKNSQSQENIIIKTSMMWVNVVEFQIVFFFHFVHFFHQLTDILDQHEIWHCVGTCENSVGFVADGSVEILLDFSDELRRRLTR